MTAYRQMITNEDGEPLGFDFIYDDAPEPDDYDGPMPYDDDPTPEQCKENKTHGDDCSMVSAEDTDLWQCDLCGERFSYKELKGQTFEEAWA